MNFKTTVILIVLLLGAGVWLFIERDRGGTDTDTAAEKKLVDVDSKDVTKIVVTPSDGQEFTLEKSGGDWKMTEPVTAPAETFEVEALVRAATESKSRGQADVTSSTGLDKPRYQVQLVAGSKTVKLAVGDKSAVGDNLYVKLNDNAKADLIAADLAEKLDKGNEGYRRATLVSASTDSIKQLSITRTDGNITMQKNGEHWQITSPIGMPADDTAVTDLLVALTGIRAQNFVDSAPPSAMARPQLTVKYSTAAASLSATAPTTEPAWTTVQFGSYDDILKKNVYVNIDGTVAKVLASSMDSFKKKPLELRDKKAVDIDPEQVSKFTVTIDRPATTQPTTMPALLQTATVERRKINPVLGPALPTTEPTTSPTTQVASTQPTTAPVLSKWVVAGEKGGDADDAKVTALLGTFHPLRADKYLDTGMPATLPSATYTVKISTAANGGATGEQQITIIDPGTPKPLIASYNGLTFETSRALIGTVEATLTK